MTDQPLTLAPSGFCGGGSERQVPGTHREAFDPERLIARTFPAIMQSYSTRDTALYALSIGLGADPLDEDQFRFLIEDRADFAALPGMATVLATQGFWPREPDTGLDWRRVRNTHQVIKLHATLPVSGQVRGEARIAEVTDEGPDTGVRIRLDQRLSDAETGALLADMSSTLLAGGIGAYDGTAGPERHDPALPERAPDALCYLPALPQAAPLYRLAGDPNPLHVSPAAARVAGFKQPIFPEPCSFGMATHAILKTCCDNRPERLRQLGLRFTNQVYPGETLRIEIWREGDEIAFRARAVERDIVVLTDGQATLGPGND